MMVGALLLAGGSGSRMRGETGDKLLHPIGSTNAFSLCIQAFLQAERVEKFVIVYKDETQLSRLKATFNQLQTSQGQLREPDIYWTPGGKERQDSVRAGLQALPDEITHILVHDCARPFIRPQTIELAASEISTDRAITVARPLKDTLRFREDQSENALIPSPTRTLDRSRHWLMETPQGAPRAWLEEGLSKAQSQQILLTDDMAAVELAGHPVGMLDPGYPNPKITTPDDFSYAEFLLKS